MKGGTCLTMMMTVSGWSRRGRSRNLEELVGADMAMRSPGRSAAGDTPLGADVVGG